MVQTMRPSDRFIPWLFVLGMLIVVIVNGALIYFATSTWSGLTADRSYERGRSYNRALASATRQEALGWAYALDISARQIAIVVSDRDGQPLSTALVGVELSRPIGPADRRMVQLTASGGGRHVAAVDPMAAGQWEARLKIQRGEETYFATERVMVK